jgi:hypothetical protein
MFAKTAIATLLLVLGASTPAWAQTVVETQTTVYDADMVETDSRLHAPRGALELGINGGYTQPFGEIQDGRAIMDTVDAGGAFGLDAGVRINPQWAFTLGGQYHESMVDDRLNSATTDVRGLALTLGATLHMMPFEAIDPFVSLGTGYRMLWTIESGPQNDRMTHGFQVARAQVGVDFRIARDLAIGPVIGADLNVFVWENPEGPLGNERLANVRPSTFLYAGIGGRFDLGGEREGENRVNVGSR